MSTPAVLPLYQVDAFASQLFGGNPAAVCPLEEWLPDATMQAVAAENNVAETAFFVPQDGGFHLRWFTPAVEVDLCGHATLATAHVLWTHLGSQQEELQFQTRSGKLLVRRREGRYALDFPARPASRCEVHPRLIEALGTTPQLILGARDYLVVYADEDEVRTLKPDMRLLSEIDRFAVIVTAPGRDVDFVSRFFAPSQGIPEDPVTGSAHCTLTPYWAGRLGKTSLRARQVSPRGGELWCDLDGDRVHIAGHAVDYLQGQIRVAV